MRRLLLPLLIVFCFVAFGAARPGSVAGPTWLLASRVAFSVVFLLAWRLRRGRAAWTIAGLAAAVESLAWAEGEARWPDLLLAIGLVLPPTLGAVAWLQEWWVVSRAGWIRGLGLAFGALGVHVLTLPAAEPWLNRVRVWGGMTPNPGGDGSSEVSFSTQLWQWFAAVELPGLAASSVEAVPAVWLAWFIGVVLAGLALWKKRTSIEAGLVGVLLASALAYGRPDELRYFAVTCAVVLAAALVENAFTLAFHDGLTGLPARRALEERLQQVGRNYALAMLDLDRFKLLNDKHGHEVGDQVLKLVATQMRGVTGGGEAFRYGGEEFMVVFAGRSAAEAQAHMDALRQEIAGRKFVVRSPGRPKKKPQGGLPSRNSTITKELKVTVSVGIAERSAKYPTKDDVMKAADKALYRSKKAGRNRVTVTK